MNTLENYYYIQFSQHNKTIANEQAQKIKNQLFEFIYDLQLQHACT